MSGETKYCDRMAESIRCTTKGDIPAIVRALEPSSVLDVGCADGRFTEYMAEMLPKKIRIDAIDRALCKYRETCSENSGNISFKTASFDDAFAAGCKTKYDCVVFSSVMHEISSYAEDPMARYSSTPIRHALELAGSVVRTGGTVVVRDMVKPSRCLAKTVPVEFRGINAIDGFFKFLAVCPYYGREYDKTGVSKFMAYDSHQRFVFNIRQDVLMEFLMTFTWGPESFPREVMEKKFILEKNGWKKTFEKAGFEIVSMKTTVEQYPGYFDKIVRVLDEKWKYPDTTCLITAKKIPSA